MKVSETETIIKRILPYLQRRGYDIDKDFTFEDPANLDTEFKKGFIDILVTLGKKTPAFLIEAKRDGAKLSTKHRKQVIEYGKSKQCLFVALTNGLCFELINVTTKELLRLNGTAFNKIPSRADLLETVLPQLKKNPSAQDIFISKDRSIPYRPGIPLTKLNHLIQQCHNSIRKIEKNEESAFADFSKILFLKLLEEKWDKEDKTPPYTYYFHELAAIPPARADQVGNAIRSMINTIKHNTKYGEVLNDPIKLRQDATYLAIVKKISEVSWSDCNLDTKGTAFEYFVRATLKGKKLGQYFTPRALVQLMIRLGKYKQILNSLQANIPFKVLDPACGTGGFLVYAMNQTIRDLDQKLKNKEIHKSLYDAILEKIKEETFFGIDAHEGVASSAKMNMIIAGDGHNNIRCMDSLKADSLIPEYSITPTSKSDKAHLIITNPPFGTSEGESLSKEDLKKYTIRSTKGQSLFLQQMIRAADVESRIVTVIDEGVLNTASYAEIRKLIFQECRVDYIISLPDETFKPNKINVKSSVLVLTKRQSSDVDLEDQYKISFVKILSLGYDGSGNELRNFDLNRLIDEVDNFQSTEKDLFKTYQGYNWEGYVSLSSTITQNPTYRFDYKFWEAKVLSKIDLIASQAGSVKVKEINLITTRRGNSPSSSEYVDESEGHALVIKAGSNISKTGNLITKGDYIEEPLYLPYIEKKQIIEDGDILLASTGDGTLGKCCVYRNTDEHGLSKPAIADGHVTVIRVDSNLIYPEYLCDYLRKGFGADQINRLFTGSTGLIEITPEDVDSILLPPLPPVEDQIAISNKLRTKEVDTGLQVEALLTALKAVENEFYSRSIQVGDETENDVH